MVNSLVVFDYFWEGEGGCGGYVCGFSPLEHHPNSKKDGVGELAVSCESIYLLNPETLCIAYGNDGTVNY